MRSSTSGAVGVLMLDTGFKRFARDIGNADSLPFDTMQRCVEKAYVNDVVSEHGLTEEMIFAFVDAGEHLVSQGASLITTSCGFLFSAQARMADALPVPVVTSSLIALPQLQQTYADAGPVGILTFDAQALGNQLATTTYDACTAPPCIVGMDPSSHFADVIHERKEAYAKQLKQDVAHAAEKLARHQPAAVLLECTNLAPWRIEVERVCKVPVVDLVDVILWVREHGLSALDPQQGNQELGLTD